MTYIEIKHSHASGTTVDFTGHPSPAVSAILKERGLRFSSRVVLWYVRQSRDKRADWALIDGLAADLSAAGHTVSVEIDDTPRTPAEIEADRADRVKDRTERYEEIAEKAGERASARLDKVQEQRSHIPFGQPIVSKAFGASVRRLNKSEEIGLRDQDTAEHFADRADAARTTQDYRYRPEVMVRRVKQFEAERRALERHGRTDGPEYARLSEQIEYWQGELAKLAESGEWVPWGPEDFRKGDEARINGTWYPVLRVNKKSLTIPALVGMGSTEYSWKDTIPYDKILGRRREGVVTEQPERKES